MDHAASFRHAEGVSAGMEYRWITDVQGFREIAEEWDRTLTSSAEVNPFLLSDFILTWAKHFLEGGQLQIFAAWQGGRLAGGLPLSIARSGARHGFVRTLRYVGASAANYTEPLYAAAEPPLLPSLREALLARDDWDVFQLTDVRPGTPLMAECQREDEGRRFPIECSTDHENWSIDLSGGIDHYLGTISKKLRRDLRAKRRHAITRYGPITLQAIQGRGAVERYFDLYTEFSRQAFRARGQRSSFSDARQRAFFREFLVLMDQRGRLDAHVLSSGEHVLALSFGYRVGPGFNWVLTAFNQADRYLRPGYLLIEDLIQELGRRGETTYNWYGYDRFYKTQWCNTQTPLYRITVIRPTLAGAWYRGLRWTERRLRSHRVVSRMRRTLSGVARPDAEAAAVP